MEVQAEKTISSLAALIFLLFAISDAQGQTTFTHQQLLQLAAHNKERKWCLRELERINNIKDSLAYVVEKKNAQIDSQDSSITILNSKIKDRDEIDSLRLEQIEMKKAEITDLKSKNEKLNRRVNFWRVFTPITVTAVSIVAIFKK